MRTVHVKHAKQVAYIVTCALFPSVVAAGQPDASWNITQADGSLWVWEFFWSIRAQPKHAEEICQLRGGHLVTVTSASISAQLAGKVTGDDTGRPSFPVLHKLDILWTGLHSPTATSSATGPW